MKGEGLLQYLFPLLFFILYFVLNRPKKKQNNNRPEPKERADHFEERQYAPKRESSPPSLPPVARTLPTFSSRIETRKLEPSLKKTPILTSMSEPLVSPELAESGKEKSSRISRGNRILKKLPSLQDAFVIREIFRRRDEEF